MTRLRALLERTVGATQQAMLMAMPHGGQRRSRINAWAEVQTGVARCDDRRSAALAVQRAIATAEAPSYAAAR
jgi:hypothetical protein